MPELCPGPYPPWETSLYILPWPPGRTHRCIQGNCGAQTHTGNGKYCYDFAMDIGQPFTAMRAGTVTLIVDKFADFNGAGKPNKIKVKHADGTIAVYLHHHKGSVKVVVGQEVAAGDELAGCGAAGLNPGGNPHLHIGVQRPRKPFMPITFRNMTENPIGPQNKQDCTSLPFTDIEGDGPQDNKRINPIDFFDGI